MQAEQYASFDRKWTVEAVYNIPDNAVKYTPSGGKITISVMSYQLFCRIDIADTGVGILESDTANIFARFHRAESAQDIDGVGLGLYLAREIIACEGRVYQGELKGWPRLSFFNFSAD